MLYDLTRIDQAGAFRTRRLSIALRGLLIDNVLLQTGYKRQ